jgi:hypothetical protein
MKNQDATTIDRRDFFRKITLGAGVAGAAAAGLAASKTKAAEPAQDPAKGAGYRETEHVKKFYDLARF